MEIDFEAELGDTVHHLSGMLRTVKRLNPSAPSATVSDALIKHLKTLTPEDLGLTQVAGSRAQEIEARARIEAESEQIVAAQTA